MAMNLQVAAAVSGGAAKALPGALKGGLKTPQGGIDFQSLLSQLSMQAQTTASAAQLLPNVVNKLTDALLKVSGKSGDATARSTLQRALTSALAPPGSSPPTAATLVQRVTDLITRLGGKTIGNNAGQQNEIPGNILDALPAKETPAPQKAPVRIDPNPGDAAAFARSLVAQAAAALPAAPQTAPAAAASAPAALEPARTAAPATPVVLKSAASAPADNLLARMLARAITADDRRAVSAQPQTTATVATAASADGIASPRTEAPVLPVAIAFEKLVAAIAAQGSSASTKDDGSQTQNGTHSGSQPLPSPATNALPLAAPHAATFANVTAVAQQKATPYTSVDANAVIEQIVKGIAVQGNGQSSQIRLRLQPEQLGEVSIKLTVNGNNISANVVAQNASVREALTAAQPQLTRSLADAGLSLGSFSVDVSGGNAGSPNDKHAFHQHGSASFKIGGWDATTPLNDDRQVYDQPVQASLQHALVINSLV